MQIKRKYNLIMKIQERADHFLRIVWVGPPIFNSAEFWCC